MLRKMVRYRVHRDKLEKVKEDVGEFVKAISENEPQTVYEAFQADDTVSFIHMMIFPDTNAEKNHRIAPYTMKFVAALYPNCDEPPTFADLRLIRSSQQC